MNVREWALPVYTILMELAVGSLSAVWVLRSSMVPKYGREKVDQALENSYLIIFITAATAMIGAQFHLSKPYFSFLAVLNVRSSWLSREILFTLLFFISVSLLWLIQWRGMGKLRLKTVLGWAAVFFGWANTYSMAQIYILPTQPAWNNLFAASSFFTTALLVGVSSLLTWLIMDLRYSELIGSQKATMQALIIQKSKKWFAATAILVVVVLFIENVIQIRSLLNSSLETVQASATLLFHLYPVLLGIRLALVAVGVGGLALALYMHHRDQKPASAMLLPAYFTCLFILVGEILGRFLFYAIHVRTGI
jgi:anaerobic dimethyl sulfoxide reductase subunit C (anchor subunit)